MTLVLRYSARSDRGLVRQNNQDSVYAGPRLLALADGMGGHAAGEVASKLVIAALVPLDDDEPGDDLLGELAEATAQGNDAITELVNEEPDLDGMGTTLTAVLFAGSRLGMVHVGDSRAYLFRDGVLTQITRDDTFVQSLIDEGRITEDEAASHPQRSLLLRALTGHDVEPSLTVREARSGDRYLLCSDGLSGVVSAETIAEALTIPDPQTCADRLIELALKGGGPDNVTCIVADVVDVDYGEDQPIYGGAAGDGRADPPPGDSAAARASAATLTRSEPTPRPDPLPARSDAARGRSRPRRSRLAVVLAVVGVIVLAGLALLVTRLWISQQYYVGVSGEQVVIYQGVRGDVLGVQLQDVAEQTGLQVGDLTQVGRMSVTGDSLPTSDLDAAHRTVERLRTDELLPACKPPAATTPTPAVPGTQPIVPTTAAAPGAQAPAAASAAPPTVSTSPQVPGRDCRRVQ
ncbi:protein phosphatase 2C domain-containing protein [Actinomycetospora endophytica]|uniref:Protein phosphatase 2C domain-containing protein n=1 Tax=Actinomycetospora endophytica TaxID=2291215 RepID=A0ABS8P523_9PSEU|nr:PP2C family serine/threonine-protein phosphatase [Actinomycetospora endophytica]MCD2193219.1 protein phosphatase 2C domain-containing protein [Actinomycetospora endophytica]